MGGEVHHQAVLRTLLRLVESLLQRLPPGHSLVGRPLALLVQAGGLHHVLAIDHSQQVVLVKDDVTVLVLDEQILAVSDVDVSHGRHQAQPAVLGSPPS